MNHRQKRTGGPMFDRVVLLQKSKLRIEEAADLLEVSPRTVQRYVEIGRLRASLTPGGHRRVLTDDVKRFL